MINSRVLQLIEDISGGNKRAFALKIGVSPTVIENIVGTRKGKPSFEVLEKIIYANENINAEWLITGKGSMTKDAPNINIIHKPTCSEKRVSDRPIPLYNINAAANLRTLLIPDAGELLGEIKIPDAPVCDGAMYVNGDSMYPLLKAGDIIAYKHIDSIEGVRYGEMYLVQYELEGDFALVVKYLQKGDTDDKIKLVSYNTYHQPQDIPRSCVNALALIKFSIRKNTII